MKAAVIILTAGVIRVTWSVCLWNEADTERASDHGEINHLGFAAALARRSVKHASCVQSLIAMLSLIAWRALPFEIWKRTTKRKLKMRAAINGRSMEQEAREILKSALAHRPRSRQAAERIREIFAPLGGVELKRFRGGDR